MPPQLNGIDHIHVYVPNRSEAARWYENVLGFREMDSLKIWSESTSGPLAIEDSSGKVHLALFQREDGNPSSAIAFGASGEELLRWKEYLQEQDLQIRWADHQVAWSLYFKDPYGNSHEITTYDYQYVADAVSSG